MDLNPSLVLEVYRSVWEEYSEWSDYYNASTLKSLEAPAPRFSLDLLIDLEETDSTDSTPLSYDNDLKFSFSELNSDGSTIDEYVISTNVVTVDQSFRPHPPYESCTPITRNLMVGDDPDTLPFIPFVDDPKYDYRLYAEEHSHFRWQEPFVDPDSMYLRTDSSFAYQINCSGSCGLQNFRKIDRESWHETRRNR